MSQVNLAPIFEFVNDMANNPATAVCGHGCIEVKHAMGTVGAGEGGRDRALKRLGAFLAKWRDDAHGFSFARTA
jgi:hypothetical protein